MVTDKTDGKTLVHAEAAAQKVSQAIRYVNSSFVHLQAS
jgi:hypothetical protein